MALIKKKLRKQLRKELGKLLIRHGEKVVIGLVSGAVSQLIEAVTGDSDKKKLKKAAKEAVREVKSAKKG